jgi:hypothetical protein
MTPIKAAAGELSMQQLEAAARVMSDAGYEITLPWEGSQDDVERGRYEALRNALVAACIAPAGNDGVNCDCGFSAADCRTNPCYRKKVATSGLAPDASYPYCGDDAAQGWQPIETAPKDVPIIVLDDPMMGEAYYHADEGTWWWCNTGPGEYTGRPIFPTLWHPMPDKPTSPVPSTDREGGK